MSAQHFASSRRRADDKWPHKRIGLTHRARWSSARPSRCVNEGTGDVRNLFQVNVEFKDLAAKLKIPVDWMPVAGVAHDTRGLCVRVGLESLKFIEAGLTSPRASIEDIRKNGYPRVVTKDIGTRGNQEQR